MQESASASNTGKYGMADSGSCAGNRTTGRFKKWTHLLYNPTPSAAQRKKAAVAIARQLMVDW
jgi:hypothetical protein